MVTKFPKRKGWEGKFLYKYSLCVRVCKKHLNWIHWKLPSEKNKRLTQADSVASAFIFCWVVDLEDLTRGFYYKQWKKRKGNAVIFPLWFFTKKTKPTQQNKMNKCTLHTHSLKYFLKNTNWCCNVRCLWLRVWVSHSAFL